MTEIDSVYEPVSPQPDWSSWTDYADRLRVEVHFREWPGAPDLDEVWVLQADGATWSYEWMKEQFSRLAASGGPGCCGSGSYMLDVNEHHQQWGASTESWEALLTLSSLSLLNNATWAALKSVQETMRRRLAERPTHWASSLDGSEELLVDEEVRAQVLAQVAKISRQPVELLTVLSAESTGTGTATFEVDGPTGTIYRVEALCRRGVILARVRRITESGPDQQS